MDLIYLDYNCFQRGFDDSKQVKIRMEALACEEIFARAERKQIKLVWSFMHEDENIVCPFPERKIEVQRLSGLCAVKVGPNKEIYEIAEDFQNESKMSSKDVVHLACASHTRCKIFITCDDELIKRSKRLSLGMKILNPVEYIGEW